VICYNMCFHMCAAVQGIVCPGQQCLLCSSPSCKNCTSSHGSPFAELTTACTRHCVWSAEVSSFGELQLGLPGLERPSIRVLAKNTCCSAGLVDRRDLRCWTAPVQVGLSCKWHNHGHMLVFCPCADTSCVCSRNLHTICVASRNDPVWARLAAALAQQQLPSLRELHIKHSSHTDAVHLEQLREILQVWLQLSTVVLYHLPSATSLLAGKSSAP
jgi:hypothetical protein